MHPTPRSQLRRLPVRGSHDEALIFEILDAGFLASVGFCVDQQPFVIPTLYGRETNTLFLHGSAASRMLQHLETGVPACVSVTLVDGLVLSRSAFDHSMNYRSVVAFGTAKTITDPALKVHALRVISEHLIAGRWNDVRGPSPKELQATKVLEFTIDEASSKVRSGPPLDDEADLALPVWAGVLPLAMHAGAPVADSSLADRIAPPAYLHSYNARLQQGSAVVRTSSLHSDHGDLS